MNIISKQMEARFLVENAIEEISKGTRKKLLDYINEGYLRTFANIVYYLKQDAEDVRDALMELSVEQRAQVLSMIENFSIKETQVIKDIEHILNSVNMTFDTEYDVIKENFFISGSETLNIIQKFKKEVPIFQDKLSHCLFNFENIVHLDDNSIQKLLRVLDLQELAIALKGTSYDVQEYFFHNMSEYDVIMLKEDMDVIGPVKVSLVNEMQYKIIKTIMQLKSEDNIEIPLVDEESEIE